MKLAISVSTTPLCIFFIFSIFIAKAQYTPPQVIPPTPNAASLGKYGETPVNLYTGQANVTIPLYDLQVGDISYPISLSYATGGIRVEDIASWVGLGWTLSGGVITRTVKGKPDDGPLGIANTPYPVIRPPHEMTALDFQRYFYYGLGQYDSEHDFFYYNLNGTAGKFVIDTENNNRPLLLPEQNTSVQHSPDFQTWTVTTDEGYKYTFDQKEYLTTQMSCTDGASNTEGPYISSWYLSKIESPKSSSYITFEYTSQLLSYETSHSERKFKNITNGGSKLDSKCTNVISNATTLRLSKIAGSNGTIIDFNAIVERCDLDGDFMLSEIVVKGVDSTPLKRIIFSYRYLDHWNIEELSSYDPSVVNNDLNLRLMLTGLHEQAYDKTSGQYSGIPRELNLFDYNINAGLPSRLSNSQDYWGYYNGQINSTAVPAMYWGGFYLSGADRLPRLQHAVEGSLKEIHYGTGGKTIFDYELNSCKNFTVTTSNGNSHQWIVGRDWQLLDTMILQSSKVMTIDASVSDDTNCDEFGGCKIRFFLKNSSGQAVFDSNDFPNQLAYQQVSLPAGMYVLECQINDATYAAGLDSYYLLTKWTEITNVFHYSAGGLRLKKIIDYDPVSNDSITRSYTYSPGYLNTKPIHNYVETFKNGCGPQQLDFQLLVRTSSSNITLANTDHGIVGYEKVIERIGSSNKDNGFTVYNYYTPNDHPDWIIVPFDWIGGGQIDLGSVQAHNEGQIDNPFPPLDDKGWKRGILRSKIHCDSSGSKVKSEHFKYRFYDNPDSTYYDVKDVVGVKVSSSNAVVCSGDVQGYLKINFYKLRSSRYELTMRVDSIFSNSGTFLNATVETFEYGNSKHLKVTKQSLLNSDGKLKVVEYRYPDDLRAVALPEMWDESSPDYKHMQGILIETVTKQNEETISTKRNIFRNNNGKVVADSHWSAFYSNPLQIKTRYHKYDSAGNPLEIHVMANENSVSTMTSYVWGYGGALPIAKIEGASYTEIEQALGGSITLQGTGGNNLSAAQSQSLRAALPHAFITTYAYDPLIGVTEVTDPNGVSTFYEYDKFGRLKSVLDDDGDLAKAHEYHYVNEID